VGEDVDDDGEEEGGGKKKGGKLKLLLILLVFLLLAGGGGAAAYFLGYLDPVIEMVLGPDAVGGGEDGEPVEPELPPLDPLDIVFIETPEILVNLQSDGAHRSYVKMKLNFELARPEDSDQVNQALPRITDALGVYLRQLSPEDFAGSEGVYRLRRELLLRADMAARPARIEDVLISELLVQ
jgi:flagellar FliL protein